MKKPNQLQVLQQENRELRGAFQTLMGIMLLRNNRQNIIIREDDAVEAQKLAIAQFQLADGSYEYSVAETVGE